MGGVSAVVTLLPQPRASVWGEQTGLWPSPAYLGGGNGGLSGVLIQIQRW